MSKLFVDDIANKTGGQNLVIKNGTNTALTIDSTGRIATPARPSFGARGYVGAVTGQGYQSTSYFGVIDHNVGNYFENSSTTGAKFTAPVAGVYHFIHFMGLRGAHNNFCSIHLDKNGALYLDGWDTSTHGSVHGHITVSAYMQLAVGDIIRAGWYTPYNAPSTGTNYGGFSGCFMG